LSKKRTQNELNFERKSANQSEKTARNRKLPSDMDLGLGAQAEGPDRTAHRGQPPSFAQSLRFPTSATAFVLFRTGPQAGMALTLFSFVS
jgi:hypothetical protein